MNEVFILLLLAHLISDFILQPTSWLEKRSNKKWKSPFLYVHGCIHFGLAFLALLMSGYPSFWYLALGIGLTHVIVDPIKTYFQNKKLSFFLDQGFHLLIILFSVAFISEFNFGFISINFPGWKVITAFIFVTKPASVIINQLLPADWNEENSPAFNPDKNQNGLKNAGMYIGILERLLVLGFILTANWTGIGFLLAAKSVFRFSDLQKAEQRKQTEYIMIGTLLSFGIAIITGWWATF